MINQKEWNECNKLSRQISDQIMCDAPSIIGALVIAAMSLARISSGLRIAEVKIEKSFKEHLDAVIRGEKFLEHANDDFMPDITTKGK